MNKMKLGLIAIIFTGLVGLPFVKAVDTDSSGTDKSGTHECGNDDEITNTGNFACLPKEVIERIAKHSTLVDLSRFNRTCKALHRITENAYAKKANKELAEVIDGAFTCPGTRQDTCCQNGPICLSKPFQSCVAAAIRARMSAEDFLEVYKTLFRESHGVQLFSAGYYHQILKAQVNLSLGK